MITTELRRGRHDAVVVRTDDADFQAVLPTFGYAREADAEFVRRFPLRSVTPDMHSRFGQCVAPLLAHAVRREAAPWEESLRQLHRVLHAEGVEWLLGGSAALAIRGVGVKPRDIDFVAADQEATARALADFLIEPPLSSGGRWFAEWFGRAWLGARIEWVAGTRPDLDDHEWTSDIGPDAVARAETVKWQGLSFRLPPLDLQLAVTRERGLHQRARAIEALRRRA